jgi:hypothetical protein
MRTDAHFRRFLSAWIFSDWREISADYHTVHPVHCKEKSENVRNSLLWKFQCTEVIFILLKIYTMNIFRLSIAEIWRCDNLRRKKLKIWLRHFFLQNIFSFLQDFHYRFYHTLISRGDTVYEHFNYNETLRHEANACNTSVEHFLNSALQ